VSSAENLLWIKILFGVVGNKLARAKVKKIKVRFDNFIKKFKKSLNII
jgi:hypothetical protein